MLETGLRIGLGCEQAGGENRGCVRYTMHKLKCKGTYLAYGRHQCALVFHSLLEVLELREVNTDRAVLDGARLEQWADE